MKPKRPGTKPSSGGSKRGGGDDSRRRENRNSRSTTRSDGPRRESAAARGDRRDKRGEGGDPDRREAKEGLAFGFHSVKTALEVNPKKVERLMLARGQRDGRTKLLVALAKEQGVPYQQVPRESIERMAGGINHQGVAARIAEAELLTPDDLLERASAPELLLALDEVEDPRNVGAVIRSAAAFGASGLFLPGHRSAGLTPAVRRTAQGGLEMVPVARAGNLTRLLEHLNEEGITPVALDLEGGVDCWDADLTGRVVIVAGSEEKGVRPGVLKACPVRVRIPIRPEIGSLNVSVAVGIVLAEAIRQRDHK